MNFQLYFYLKELSQGEKRHQFLSWKMSRDGSKLANSLLLLSAETEFSIHPNHKVHDFIRPNKSNSWLNFEKHFEELFGKIMNLFYFSWNVTWPIIHVHNEVLQMHVYLLHIMLQFLLTIMKVGLINFQQILQYNPGRWPSISSTSPVNLSNPVQIISILLFLQRIDEAT